MTVEEFIESMAVKVNILNEERRIAEQNRRNVQAMLEASNKESM
jgi:hypothetical protein